MKYSTGVRHLEELAAAMNELPGLDSDWHPRSLWAYGDLLDGVDSLEYARVALTIDRPPDQVPWFARPAQVEWVKEVTRLSKRPVHCMWRSARLPVWNHAIVRPLLLWDADGIRRDALDALRSGRGIDGLRLPDPTPDELATQLRDEAAANLAAMRAAVAQYDDNRWGRGSITRHADGLWDATAGYLDLLDAIPPQT